MIKGILWFAAVFAMSPFLLVCVVANRMLREKGTERYHEEDDGLGENDPGVDVDAEPINGDGTGMAGWPASEPPRYNGSGEPCDMRTGPCSCGAWHHEGK